MKQKKYIAKQFGFAQNKIVLLELDSDLDYVMFEVCGIEYQVHHGELSIYKTQ